MKLDELITDLAQVRHVYGNIDVKIAHASSGNPEQKVSGVFPLLQVDTNHGVTLVQSNYIDRQTPYIQAVFPDKEPVE